LAVAAALALGACSAIGGGETPHTISVTGSGVSRLAPDIVLITLGVHTQGPDIGEAVDENNQRAAQVMAAIQEMGMAAADVSTSNFSIYSQPQYDEFGNPTEELIYSVDNNVSLILREPDTLGQLLQAALTRGANTVNSVTYSVEDPSDALDEARREAMEDARQQAEQLAAAAGVELGEVMSVGEPGVYAVPAVEAPAYGKGGGGGVPTAPGTLEYQVQLSVTYRIR
jgi:hypothetical protein